MTPIATNPEAALAEAIGTYALDPYAHVLFCWPWGVAGTPLEDSVGPRDWQRDVLQDIGERLRAGYSPSAVLMPVLKAVASGHGIGKSALVAWLIHWAMSTCPDTKAVLTANTEPQLRTKTMPEVSKWFRMAINAHWFKVAGMSIHSVLPGHDKTWRCDAVTWSDTNLEAFAGLHNKGKRILLLFDEASGIIDRVWEVAEGALTDEDTEIVWCAFGNPTQPTGRFHECFGRQRQRWRGLQIDSRSVPGTNKALFAEWVDLYGEDSDFVRVRVRGMFPRAGSNQFIGSELVASATGREIVTILSDALVMGVDPARFGTDQSVIFFRKGRDGCLIPPIKLRGVDTMQLAARVADEAQRYKADAVFVDGGGVGGGVVDRCRQLRVAGLVEVQFGGKADRGLDADGTRYANKRAEMWGNLRAWLKTGAIPPDADLRAQLIGPLYTYNLRNEIQLEKKEDMMKRGLESPDLADALALTFALPVSAHARAGGEHLQKPLIESEYDPFSSERMVA